MAISGPQTELNAKQFGATGDGTTDDTAAIQAAFDAAADIDAEYRPEVVIPAGNYLVTDTLDCQDYITVRGAGKQSTTLRFTPTAGSKACIQFADTAPYHWFGGLSDMRIVITNSAYDNLAGVYVECGTRWRMTNVIVDAYALSTNKDWYGLRLAGREQLQVKDCSFITPIGIYFHRETLTGVGLDNSAFTNMTYLSPPTVTTNALPFAAVYVEPKCALQNVIFDGHQTVVRKKHAFHYQYAGQSTGSGDPITESDSGPLTIRGLRSENMTDATAYEFDFNGAATKDLFTIENSRLQGPCHGIIMQNGKALSVKSVRFQSQSKIAIKTSGANTFYVDDGCSYRDGTTAELASWWQTYQATSIESARGSAQWIVSFPANADNYYILPHIRRYKTANSTAKTITALQSDDYTQSTGFNATHEIELIVDANTTVQHGTGTDGIELRGAVDFNPGAEASLRLRYDGTRWKETSRSTA